MSKIQTKDEDLAVMMSLKSQEQIQSPKKNEKRPKAET